MLIWAIPINNRLAYLETRSSVDGVYRITGLDDGQYELRTENGRSFEIAIDGDTIFDIQIGTISLAGTVRSHRSVFGARVTVIRNDDDARNTVSTGVNNQGFYRFDGLEKETYELRVTHEEFEPVSQVIQLGSSQDSVDIPLYPRER